jgi:hypothetical protein
MAQLILSEINDALARGTRHYDKSGRLLETTKEILDALLRDGHIEFQPADKTDQRFAMPLGERERGMAITHVPFNPMLTLSLDKICADWERGGWALVRVVSWRAFEFVAVFERTEPAPDRPQTAPSAG